MQNSFILIKNGTIFTHDKTIYNMDILIENNKVIDIDTNIKADNCDIIDAKGLYIIPGLIDMHCEISDPGFDYRESFETAGLSAIYGGFTSITCNPNTDPVIDNKTVVDYVLSKSKSECPVNVYPYGSLTKKCKGEKVAEMGEMQLAGIVALSDGDNPIQSSSLMRTLLQYGSMFDMPTIVHSEDINLSSNSGINEGYISSQLGMIGAPISAETSALTRNILLAEEFGGHLHVSHISTERSVDIIRMAKKKGIKITAETSPQYFVLDETSTLAYNSYAKVNPPLRTKKDVEAVKKGIQDGTIDIISSDHKPNTIDSKDVEFDLASFGISAFETAFSLAYTYLVGSKIITLEQLIEKMSYKPAKLLTINKGNIGIGKDADIMIFDPNEEFEVNSKGFKSKARYSPFDGFVLKGKIRYTIVNGKKYDLMI